MIAKELDEISRCVRVQQCSRSNTNCPWCKGNEYHHLHQSLCLHREILDFTRWIQPTPEDTQLRFIVIRKFRNAIKFIWPNASILCHGSSATNTYLPNGDIDLLVINPPSGRSDIDLLKELNGHLRSLSILKSSIVIKSAKCPIIKGTEKPFGYKIDISINNINGVLNIQRNENLLKKYPPLYPLLFVLKFFLFENNLDEPYQGGIGSNTLIQMIVFIIQSGPQTQKMNLGSLFTSFFQTFGLLFNYITTGISTRYGGKLFSRMDVEEINWRQPVNICVEDPQLPGLFLGENAFECSTFRSKCLFAFNQLKKSNSNDQSILARIFHTSQLILKSRKSTMDLYNSVLHRKLKIEFNDVRDDNNQYNQYNSFKRGRISHSISSNFQKERDSDQSNINGNKMDYMFYYRQREKFMKKDDNDNKSSFIAPSHKPSNKNYMSTSASNGKNFYSFQKPLLYRR